jgi:hypothetical protein
MSILGVRARLRLKWPRFEQRQMILLSAVHVTVATMKRRWSSTPSGDTQVTYMTQLTAHSTGVRISSQEGLAENDGPKLLLCQHYILALSV